MVSRQGDPIADLAELRRRLTIVRTEIGDAPISCPDDRAAIRVHPEYIEYWTAAADALHDRIAFEWKGNGWCQIRLAP